MDYHVLAAMNIKRIGMKFLKLRKKLKRVLNRKRVWNNWTS